MNKEEQITSKACLEFKNGMHLQTVSSIEFQYHNDWYRAEVYRTNDGSLAYAGYQRIGAYWRPITSSEEPTCCPEVLDSYGAYLLRQARSNIEKELALQ